MRKFSILPILFFILFSEVHAQISDKLVPHMGFMYEFVRQSEGDTVQPPFTATDAFYMVHVGTYYALGHTNDVASFGIDGSIQLGIRPSQSGISWIAQVPLFIMGKVGANCTPYNEQKVGIAAGVGANFTYMDLNNRGFINDPFNGDPISLDISKFIFNPQVVVEGTFNNITGRVHFSFYKPVDEGIVFQDVAGGRQVRYPFPQVSYNNFGVGILYGF